MAQSLASFLGAELGTATTPLVSGLFDPREGLLVVALGVMRLVREGRLDLDRNVNDYLTSWKLPACKSRQLLMILPLFRSWAVRKFVVARHLSVR